MDFKHLHLHAVAVVFPIGGHARPFALCELRGHQRNHNTRGKAVAGKPLDLLDIPGVGDNDISHGH